MSFECVSRKSECFFYMWEVLTSLKSHKSDLLRVKTQIYWVGSKSTAWTRVEILSPSNGNLITGTVCPISSGALCCDVRDSPEHLPGLAALG